MNASDKAEIRRKSVERMARRSMQATLDLSSEPIKPVGEIIQPKRDAEQDVSFRGSPGYLGELDAL